MRFAAIDIGSNAVRLLIADIHQYSEGLRITKLSLTRVPVRLGASVFENGRISNAKARRLEKTIKAFRYLIEVYDVKAFKICATSAMREASNKEEIIQRVRDFSGLTIEVIDGKTEANLIFSTFITQKLSIEATYLYIDVGGGSTEITLLKNGKRIKSRSFKLGTVRLLKGRVDENNWEELKKYVADIAKNEEKIIGIGTGGNINRLFKMHKLSHGEYLSIDQLKSSFILLNSYSVEERIDKFRLRPDRADVIVPAARIFHTVMRAGNIQNLLVPKIGLSDGITLYLYNQYKKEQEKKL